MNKINRGLIRIIDFLTLILVLPLAFFSVFFSRGVDFDTFREVTVKAARSPFLDIFFTLLFIFIIFCVTWIFRGVSEKNDRIISVVLQLVMIAITTGIGLWWINNNPFLPVADQERIWTAAVAIAKGEMIDGARLPYFDTYPSQKAMVILTSCLIKILGNSVVYARYFNLCMVIITQIFIILCAREIKTGTEFINLLTAILTFFIPFAMLSGFIYGHIAAIAFSTIGIYGMIKFLRLNRKAWLLLPALFLPVAIMAYHASMIVFMAFAVIMIWGTIYYVHDKRNITASLITIIAILILEMTLSSVMGRAFDKRLGKISDGGDGTPAIAYVVSGIEAEGEIDFPGGGSGEKELYEENGRDTKKTAEVSTRRVLNDISQYIKGERSLTFFAEKTAHQWFEPWFGAVTMTVYKPDSGDSEWDRFVQGDTLRVIEKFLHVLMIFVYFGTAVCQIARIKNNNDNLIACFPNVYFIGGFIFQFFWEQKARYCLSYYLALFPLAAAGIAYITHYVIQSVNDRNHDCEKENIPKKVYLLVTFLMAFIIAGLYIKDKSCYFIPYTDYSDSRDAYYTDDMALYGGDYGITLEYTAGVDTEVSMYLDDTDTKYPAVLDKNENEFYYELHLDEYNDDIHFGYNAEKEDDFKLERVHVEAKKALFTDHAFLAVCFLAIAIIFFRYFTSRAFSEKTGKEKIWLVLLFVSVAVSSLPLFSGTLFWGADDPAHVMRLEGIKDALMNRQFPVFVFPKNDSGYGLLGYMYPSLFMYIPALLRIMRVSIPTVMNSLYFVFNVITAVVAYYSAREIYEEKEPSYMFAVLYLLLPYRLVNIYNRADVGETLGMCFLPMIIAGMYMCLDDEKRKDTYKAVAYITLGMTAIINSHVLSSALIVGFVVLYALIFIKRLINKDFAKILIGSLLCTILLNAGYIVPFVKLYTFGLNISDMTHKVFSGRFAFADLISVHDFSTGSAWGGISLIGVLGIIIFIVGAIKGKKKNGGIKERFMVVSGIISLVLFLMVPSEFPWDIILKADALKKVTGVLQFAFRFMMLAAPLLVLVTVYYIYEMESDTKRQRAVVTAVILTAAVSVMPAICNEMRSEPYMQKLSGGASNIILREYWPQGVTDGVFNDDFLFWSSENLVFEGYEKNGLRVDFDYYTLSGEDESIQPPILYYPGYKAVAVTSEGEKYNLGVSRGDYYRVRIDLPAALSGSHVKFYYGGLWYFYIAYAISVISAVVFTVIYIRRYKDVTRLNSSGGL